MHSRNSVDRCPELGSLGLIATAIRTGRRRAPGCCSVCGHRHDREALPAEYLYLLGIYLGDGCISAHARGVYRLRVFLDAKYPAIIDEVVRAIGVVVPTSKVGRSARNGNYPGAGANSHFQISSYSRSWPCLIPQHGRGRKHERKIELASWQETFVERDPRPLLRGLIHSDGCRSINTGRGGWRHPRYSFSNFSVDILDIYARACETAGLRYTRCPGRVYVSRKADVARMDEFVGPKR